MRLLAYLAATVAGLLLLASPVFAFVAIWTVGPDSDRLGWTACLSFLFGALGSIGAALWIEEVR